MAQWVLGLVVIWVLVVPWGQEDQWDLQWEWDRVAQCQYLLRALQYQAAPARTPRTAPPPERRWVGACLWDPPPTLVTSPWDQTPIQEWEVRARAILVWEDQVLDILAWEVQVRITLGWEGQAPATREWAVPAQDIQAWEVQALSPCPLRRSTRPTSPWCSTHRIPTLRQFPPVVSATRKSTTMIRQSCASLGATSGSTGCAPAWRRPPSTSSPRKSMLSGCATSALITKRFRWSNSNHSSGPKLPAKANERPGSFLRNDEKTKSDQQEHFAISSKQG